jgi:hypothetical protein
MGGGERRLARAAGGATRPVLRDPRHPRLFSHEGRTHRRAVRPRRGRSHEGPAVVDRPASRVLERLRQVPVVERDVGCDPPRAQLVHEAVVEVEPRRVHGARAVGDDARPGHGEPVGVEAELRHQGDVLAVPVVVVAGHVAVVTPRHPAGRMGEPIPDALAAPVLGDGALDLVGGGGGAPQEPRRERILRHPRSPLDGSGFTPCVPSDTTSEVQMHA